MITNLKFILRSMSRNKVFAGINILGLAVGVAAVLLIYRIVDFELSFNKGFKNYDRIVRIVRYDIYPEGENWITCVPTSAGDAIQASVPQFEEFSRVRELWPTIAVPDPAGGAPLKKFTQTDGETSFFAEPAFLKILEPTMLAGDPNTALRDAGTVILTQSMAEKCFGNWQSSMNQTVIMDGIVPLVVRGVVADFPTNCDFPIHVLVSYPTLIANGAHYNYDPESWGSCSSNSQAYALLKDVNQWDDAEAVLATVGQKEYNQEARSEKTKRVHHLQALSDLHYNEDLYNSGGRIMTKNRLRVLSFIGLLVLAMACFNFINLSTAQATQRAKEVGVRKTLGVSKGQLIGQFMTETAAVTVISVALGLVLAILGLPLLKLISDVPADAPFLTLPHTWAFLLVLAVAVTLLAGFYPSMVLAGFQPSEALKSNASSKASSSNSFFMKGHSAVREGLVVFQFAIAAALIVGALVTLAQLDYIRNKDLGFDKNLIYTFNYNNDSTSLTKLDALRQQLAQIPTVESISFCSDHPSSGNIWNTNFAFPSSAEDAQFSLSLKFADEAYMKTYGLRLLAGKWYEPSDTIRHGVVNQTLLKKLGITDPNEVVGQELKLGGRRRVQIVGVVQDFHSHSVHDPLEPILIIPRKQFYYNAGVKIMPTDLASTTAAIQKVFDQIYPEQVFTGRYFDENIAQFYEDENRFSNTCKGFGLLAVFIACLGLFGLSMHAAARRTKEIGIRKVLGASIVGITGMLAKDFLKLVLLSLFIGFPLAWWLMNKWLADFAFHIDITWAVFAMAGTTSVAVAFLTVSFQSVKAALSNPIKSLRSE